MAMRYNTIIFDLDGTLLDTLEDLADATNYALRSLFMPERTIDEIRSFVGNGARRLMELAVPEGTANPKFDEAFAMFREYYALHCNDKTKPYAGILPLLRELKDGGVAIAIVSNKLDPAVKELSLTYFGGLADTAIGEQEGIARKPSPDTVFAALRELGRTTADAVYIGDSDVDIMTAKNAGLPCISVLWGFRSQDFLQAHGATQLAAVPEDVKKFLQL